MKWGHTINASLLVAGTCIGGGMLALPVSTAAAGFLPSFVLMFLSWAFMTLTGLLVLEANLWMKEGSHLVTISTQLLGPIGKWVTWIVYLFLSYASLIAYIAGGGEMMRGAVEVFTGILLPKWAAFLLFILLFGIIIDWGARVVGRVNTVLVAGMCAAYVLLVVAGIPYVQHAYLFHKGWSQILWAAPIVLTTFSYQFIVPSLTIYLKGDYKALKWAIMGGTTLTLIVYLLWEYLILGTVPRVGPDSLSEAFERGIPATDFYRTAIGNPWISAVASFFAFFALATSFLGLGLGLFDFLSDGLKIKKKGWGKWFLGSLIVIPSLFFTLNFERCFLVALDTTGGFGDAILSGIMPALMVWSGRYFYKHKGLFKVAGGRALLVAAVLFYLSVLGLEIYILTK